MSGRVEVTKDEVGKVVESLEALADSFVLVGIPSKNASRDDDSDINNAAIGYVMEFGSPVNNVPARPFLIPGVQKAEKQVITQLRKALDGALAGDQEKIVQSLNAAGILASNEVRGEINSNLPPPLKPSTIANRFRQRKQKKRREAEQGYLGMVAKGIEPGAAQSEAGIVSLINTGQLRNSITYVVVTDKKDSES